MRIAVIGMGSVGATLGRRWAELGHTVTFGARDPGEAKAKTLVAAIEGKAAVARVSEAVAASEVVVLKLVAKLGFEADDAGALKVARLLEPLAMLWIQLMVRRNLGRRFAFGLLRKDA